MVMAAIMHRMKNVNVQQLMWLYKGIISRYSIIGMVHRTFSMIFSCVTFRCQLLFYIIHNSRPLSDLRSPHYVPFSILFNRENGNPCYKTTPDSNHFWLAFGVVSHEEFQWMSYSHTLFELVQYRWIQYVHKGQHNTIIQILILFVKFHVQKVINHV